MRTLDGSRKVERDPSLLVAKCAAVFDAPARARETSLEQWRLSQETRRKIAVEQKQPGANSLLARSRNASGHADITTATLSLKVPISVTDRPQVTNPVDSRTLVLKTKPIER